MVRASATTELILASASPRRRQLLKRAGFKFKVRSARYSEGDPSGDPAVFAQAASRGKARAVARRLRRPAWVLGADTVVAQGKKIYGKPKNPEHARRMLQALSGKEHEVLTGVTLAEGSSGKEISWVERTRVWMRKISPRELEAYLAGGEWHDKAGGYGIQGEAGAFVTRVDGCYFNVVGLPLAKVSAVLRQRGVGK